MSWNRGFLGNCSVRTEMTSGGRIDGRSRAYGVQFLHPHTRKTDSNYLTAAEMADQDPDSAAVTQWLLAWSDGHRDALDHLLPLVYRDLRRLAAGYMQREAAGHALQPTALVHEAYVRLVDQRQVQWRNRAHFFGVAAGMMRRILVDHARERLAEKRGGGLDRVTLIEDQIAAEPAGVDVMALHESLERLAALDPRQAQIIELRYFGGLTIDETAEVVGASAATVVREWTVAKAWLRADLTSPPKPS
jgi:RNA polymerase sigma factor (TIGR02999 family)